MSGEPVAANFVGVRVDAATYPEMLRKIEAWRQDKTARSRHVAPINAYCATLTLRDERLRRIYGEADIAGPDGMPFVAWIRAFVRPHCDRFYAPDIVYEAARHGELAGWTFYLYGGSDETCAGMRRHLLERFPRLRIVGSHAPPFRPPTAEEDAAICAELDRLQPDIVCVGLGTPKQDYWIADHRDRVRGTVFFGCGATFDFFGGRIRMAPRLVQRSGFEWLWRLLSRDFFRLWHRYTVMNARFLWHFALQVTGLRVRAPLPRPGERGNSIL